MSLMPMLHAGKKEIWEAELALEYWNISSSLKLQSFQKIHMTIVQIDVLWKMGICKDPAIYM